MKFDEIITPALIVEHDAFEHNLKTMAEALPGAKLRPHVKAHKSSAIAKHQRRLGHKNFTCATIGEVIGLAKAGLGDDILLANETLQTARLKGLDARITIAIDSTETIAAAVGNVEEVLIDVNVGLQRCGCNVQQAGKLADLARKQGLVVRGVMGYEGHTVGEPAREQRVEATNKAMAILAEAHKQVGGDIISAGGTGTYDINTYANEIQAGSYVFMDNAYDKLNLPFKLACCVLAEVIHRNDDYAVLNAGLKAFGMDKGKPTIDDCEILSISDEHIVFRSDKKIAVGQRFKIYPAHIDPTVSYHKQYMLLDGEQVIETMPVDLAQW